MASGPDKQGLYTSRDGKKHPSRAAAEAHERGAAAQAAPAPAAAPPPAFTPGPGWTTNEQSPFALEMSKPENQAGIAAGPGEAILGDAPTFVEARERNTTAGNRLAGRQDQMLADEAYTNLGIGIIDQQQNAAVNETTAAQGPRADQVSQIAQGYKDATRLDTTAGDEARALQQSVVDRQLALLDEILAFDPQAEAARQSERGLSASLAQARSARGGAGAVASATDTALQGAPMVQAEAFDKAQQTQTDRYGQAAGILNATGNLTTNVRGQDENRSQFEVTSGLDAQRGISEIFGVDMQLTSQEQQQLGKLRVEFANQYAQWAELDLREQVAVLDSMTQQYATSANLYAQLQRIRAEVVSGKKSPLDYALAFLSSGGQAAAAIKGAG